MARNFQIKVINPYDPQGEQIDAIIPASLYVKWYKDSATDYWNLETAKEVLEHPHRIFERVRVYEQGGFCYVGKPVHWYIRPACRVPVLPKRVFAVYLNPNMRLYEARLEFAAEDDPYSPINWQDRYGALLWKSIS